MSSSSIKRDIEEQPGDRLSETLSAVPNIPSLPSETDPAYPLLSDPEQLAAAEHFAVLRAHLLNSHTREGIRSVLITSAQKGEGKSLISTNLAISLAQLAKYRVLLVDGDLRVAGITDLLRLHTQPGVVDFLQGTHRFEEVVRPSGIPLLSVVGAGAVATASVSCVLEGPKWPSFIEQAKQHFDLIIVDSVPVIAPIADFELLAAPCDRMLLIVHLHKTNRELLERTVQQVNGKTMGLIINNAEPRRGYDYAYYYKKDRK